MHIPLIQDSWGCGQPPLIHVGPGFCPHPRCSISRGIFTLLLVPASFILLSSVAIIFSLSPEPLGLLDLPLPGGYWFSAKEKSLPTDCRKKYLPTMS